MVHRKFLIFIKVYFLVVLLPVKLMAQPTRYFFPFTIYGDVKVTIDVPADNRDKDERIIILYALPNGNTTEQTMGKKLQPGDDWHFDIQHIKAQTDFLRKQLPNKYIAVVYLENNYKSWPQWKTKHPNCIAETQHIVDTIFEQFHGKRKLYFNGHSGGGRFIFNYLDGVQELPGYVENISFLDSDYGYDSTYTTKITNWLKENKNARLNVFAYNDSVALLDGKRIVSDTGGTWYRSHLMMRHLAQSFSFTQIENDSLVIYKSSNKKIRFNFKTNPDRKIFHTQQVELNGFIHSILTGTKKESVDYIYFGPRAYTRFIE